MSLSGSPGSAILVSGDEASKEGLYSQSDKNLLTDTNVSDQ